MCCARTTAAADSADGAVPRAACVASSEAVAGRRAHPAAHVLLAPGDAWSTGDERYRNSSDIASSAMTQRYMHLSPAALDARFGCSIGRGRTEFWRHFGDGVATEGQWLEQLKWR